MNSTLTEMVDDFINQCMNYLNEIYKFEGKEEYISRAKYIENCILCRKVYEDCIGYPYDVPAISEEWWEQYEEMENEEEQEYVMNVIRDIFPDVWRP